jgi:nitrite reductase/ring-hydroxylating ferredoxin subunit
MAVAAVNGRVRDLVRDDREAGLFGVHRVSMTSQEILDLERELIFDRCWLYLGHSSELPEPGEYRRRSVAGRSIIFVRGDDGEIRAFHNTSPHRGAIVCRHDEGNAKAFQCFYHAWTFNSRGKLTGIPGKDAYEGGCFDPAERSLEPVARLEWRRTYVREPRRAPSEPGGARRSAEVPWAHRPKRVLRIRPVVRARRLGNRNERLAHESDPATVVVEGPDLGDLGGKHDALTIRPSRVRLDTPRGEIAAPFGARASPTEDASSPRGDGGFTGREHSSSRLASSRAERTWVTSANRKPRTRKKSSFAGINPNARNSQQIPIRLITHNPKVAGSNPAPAI